MGWSDLGDFGAFWERAQEAVEAEHCYGRALEMRPHSERLRSRLLALRTSAAGRSGSSG